MAEKVLDTAAHHLRGLVGEGDCEDLAGACTAGFDQPGKPVSQHASLAGTGAGKHQERTAVVSHGLTLRLVQTVEQSLYSVGCRLRGHHSRG